ncbi:Protein of unknown function [Bacillus cereus]|nr:Protein of unknown function [Bacillus cereus]
MLKTNVMLTRIKNDECNESQALIIEMTTNKVKL